MNVLDELQDIVLVIISGLNKLQPKDLLITVVLALVFSLLVAAICINYSKLWNKTYKANSMQVAMTLIASIVTLVCVLAYVGLSNIEEVATTLVIKWKAELKSDQQYEAESFFTAYYKVKDLGLENFTGYQSPEEGGNFIPTNHDESRLLSGKIYTENAIFNFKKRHAFLGALFSVNADEAPERIKEDMESHFNKTKTAYLSTDAIEIASSIIQDKLLEQTPKVVYYARIVLVTVFFIAQLIPFGFIGYAAYNQLKVRT